MRLLHSTPFLRIFLYFVVGLTIASAFELGLYIIILGFLLSLLGAILFGLMSSQHRIKFLWVRGLLLFLGLLFLGMLLPSLHQQIHPKQLFSEMGASKFLLATITSMPAENEKSVKYEVRVDALIDSKKNIPCSVPVFLYIKKEDTLKGATTFKLKEGDRLLLKNRCQLITNRGNPGEFDYASFCHRKGVYEQVFLNSNDWKQVKTGKSETNFFSLLRAKIQSILKNNLPNKNAAGIAQALFLGYRQEIDQETYASYTQTGLVHLIAISGLHMGIFYGVLYSLLGFLPLFERKPIIRIGISLLFMWLFALLTSLPPSVLRAAIMFSFLGLGQILNRKTSSLNFLFASAFLLLCWNPNLLYDVGFQLSYAAVFGILLFYKPLKALYFSSFSVVNGAYGILCVSLAAQIFTFLLGIYYFHQMPLLFLFTNLIAIPAITIIVYTELLLVLISGWPWMAKWLGQLLSDGINLLNQGILFTSKLSFVGIQDILLSNTQLIIIYALILSVCFWLLDKKKLFLPVALFFGLCLVLHSIYGQYKTEKQERLIVYNYYKQPYLEVIHGTSYFTPDAIPDIEESKFEQYLRKPAHLLFGVNSKINSRNLIVLPHYDLLLWNGLKIVRIKRVQDMKILRPIACDYLIISDKYLQNVEELLPYINAKSLIIDGNIPLWKIDQLKTQLAALALPAHYVALSGAKVISL